MLGDYPPIDMWVFWMGNPLPCRSGNIAIQNLVVSPNLGGCTNASILASFQATLAFGAPLGNYNCTVTATNTCTGASLVNTHVFNGTGTKYSSFSSLPSAGIWTVKVEVSIFRSQRLWCDTKTKNINLFKVACPNLNAIGADNPTLCSGSATSVYLFYRDIIWDGGGANPNRTMQGSTPSIEASSLVAVVPPCTDLINWYYYDGPVVAQPTWIPCGNGRGSIQGQSSMQVPYVLRQMVSLFGTTRRWLRRCSLVVCRPIGPSSLRIK